MTNDTVPASSAAERLGVRLVMIDLDGTIAHSAPDIAASANRMLEALGMSPHPLELVESFIGNGVPRLIERALTGDRDGVPDPELFARARPLFEKYYAENVCDLTRAYPGAIEGIEALDARGFRLVCITNKAEAFTLPLLRALGVLDRFDLVLSGDALPKKKPDPMPLHHACERFGVPLEEAVFVGDSIHDLHAAQNAGVRAILVPYGYNHGMDVRTAGAYAVVESLLGLDQLLVLAPS